jgi:UPF0716 protein FxsA
VLAVLVVLFLVLPIAELYVIVQVASGVGVLNTIGLLILVSVVGAWLCRREGMSVLGRLRAALDRYELPHRELVDGALVLFAGALLLTPGFLTDVLGVLLLLPPTRVVVRRAVLRTLARRTAGATVIRRIVDTTGAERP